MQITGSSSFLLFLIQDNFTVRVNMTILTIQIISAQHLPKTTENDIDPYVTVQILGHPFDQHKFSTKHVAKNGEIKFL